ncbi:MAG: hypothetical protein K0M56_10075 [Kaistella sp.]|nr:hypothetical protein [Kaistella sp.]
MKKIVFLFSLFAALQLFSQEKTQADKMLDEVQKITQTQNNMKIVWWIPSDYWQVAIGETGRATEEQIAVITNLLDDYTIIVAGDYTLDSPEDTVDFKVNSLSKGVVLYGLQGQKVQPLNESQIDDKVLTIINEILKPLFTQMLGKMGSGLTFFVYNNKTDGKLIIDPRKPGSFRLEVNNDVFQWNLPLVSMMAEKTCPVDQKVLPGNYVYCPVHGSKL